MEVPSVLFSLVADQDDSPPTTFPRWSFLALHFHDNSNSHETHKNARRKVIGLKDGNPHPWRFPGQHSHRYGSIIRTPYYPSTAAGYGAIRLDRPKGFVVLIRTNSFSCLLRTACLLHFYYNQNRLLFSTGKFKMSLLWSPPVGIPLAPPTPFYFLR